jgi:hypothetical protein
MKITLLIEPNRLKVVAFALTVAFVLLPCLTCPQKAEAQGAGTTGADGAHAGRDAVFVVTQQTQPASTAPSQTDRVGANDGQNGNMNIANAIAHDARLAVAISDIKTAWNRQDIHPLLRHVHRDKPVAIYLKGKLYYSLDGDNYLSVTRDSFTAAKTVSFSLDKIQPQDRGGYTLSGHYAYTDRGGKLHTMQISFTLEKTDDDYYLIRVDTTPEKLSVPGPTAVPTPQPVDPTLAARPTLPTPVIRQEVASKPPLPVSQQPASIPPSSSQLPVAQHRSLSPPGVHAYLYDYSAVRYPLTGSEWAAYFPSHSVHYPHYYLHFFSGITAPSVYYYYDGALPPYIGSVSVIAEAPRSTLVSYPLYTSDGSYQGDLDGDSNGRNGNANIADAARRDSLLANAILDIETAWNRQDIRFLARHVYRDTPVAVHMKGKFLYSLDGGDYLRITRDAVAATKTISFALDKVRQKARGIYTVSGRHSYTDKDGASRTVLVSYVLERVEDDYYLTQVGTAPTKLER